MACGLEGGEREVSRRISRRVVGPIVVRQSTSEIYGSARDNFWREACVHNNLYRGYFTEGDT